MQGHRIKRVPCSGNWEMCAKCEGMKGEWGEKRLGGSSQVTWQRAQHAMLKVWTSSHIRSRLLGRE